MKFPKQYTLEEIASILSCSYVGEKDFPILGMNEIHVVEPGDIVFVDHPKYYEKALASAATIILINKEVTCPKGKALLVSDDPFRDFNKLTEHFRPFRPANGARAVSASIGENTVIQPNVFIGNNVTIGNNCVIHPNVTIYDNCIIEDYVTVHANTVIGSDAFYYKNRETGFDKLKSGGRVIVKNRVDIGASCTIDRGVSGDTTIGEGSKLDNQVHIGHDVVIGSKVLIASQVGIAGCVVIEDEAILWGQVGVKSDVVIGKGAVLMAQSGVNKSLEGGKVYFGTPAVDTRIKYREIAATKQLPNLIKKML